MTIVYCCRECGNEVETEGLSIDEAMTCPDHPSAIIESVIMSEEARGKPLRLDMQIDAEMDRLGWSSTTAPEGNSTLDCWESLETA